MLNAVLTIASTSTLSASLNSIPKVFDSLRGSNPSFIVTVAVIGFPIKSPALFPIDFKKASISASLTDSASGSFVTVNGLPSISNVTEAIPDSSKKLFIAVATPVPAIASNEFISVSINLTSIKFPFKLTINLSVAAWFLIVLYAFSTKAFTSTTLPKVTVNSVELAVLYPSSKATVTVIVLSTKSPALLPNCLKKFSTAVLSTVSPVIGKDTSPIFNVTPATPSSFKKLAAAVATPVPINASIEFISVSFRITLILFPSFENSKSSAFCPIIVLYASFTKVSTSTFSFAASKL